MRLLAIEKELAGRAGAIEPRLLEEEAAAVWALQQEEVIREIWFTRADRRAVILLECATIEEARARLADLPLVAHGRIDFEVHALRPYDGFSRLMR